MESPKSDLLLHQRHFRTVFAQGAGLDEVQVEHDVREYNTDFSVYGPEVYQRLTTRIAHWDAYLAGNWFQRRLDVALEAAANADVVLDLGFSVPYAYTVSAFRKAVRPRFVFVDNAESAFEFYRLLVGQAGWEQLAQRDLLVKADLEDSDAVASILRVVQSTRAKSIVVIASEVVEHLTNDGPLWQLLSAIGSDPEVERAAAYVTLPIGRRIPSHMKEFRKIADAQRFLRSELLIRREGVLEAPPESFNREFLSACFWVEADLRRPMLPRASVG